MSAANARLAAGLLLGLVGNLLVRAPGAPALNLALWIALIALMAAALHRRGGGVLSGEARVLLVLSVAFGALLAWRDAPPLKLLALASAAVLLSLPALRAGAAWVRRGSIGEFAAALAGAGLYAFGGAVPALAEAEWRSSGSQPALRRHAAAATRGVVLAVPFLLVFGSLLMAADAVFASYIMRALRIDVEVLASHIVLTGVLAWLATGYVRGLSAGTRLPLPLPQNVLAVRTGAIEGAVMLGVVNLLFLSFVVVQFTYLFGGAELVVLTPGLTYAEYARRGFFELVVVTLLVLPLLLLVDWLLRRESVAGRSVVRALSGLQIALVLCIAASALHRMRAYQAAYGMTEQRLYATALLVLLVVTLLYFAATVLRGRRRAFMPGTLAAALTTVALLSVLNPDALIARTNLARLSGQDTVELDAGYLAGLSGDAVPLTLHALPALPDPARCVIARSLLRRFGAGHEDFRTWSWSRARAERLVRRDAAQLRRAAAACDPQRTG